MKNILSAFLMMLLIASPVSAQTNDRTVKSFDDYLVHYSVLNSTFIQPDTAKQYGLKRGTDIGLVNIAVHKKDGDSSHAVKANITGKTANLIQQQEQLKFQIVEEGSSIYYLASFRFATQEVLHFTLEIAPEDADPLTLKFTRSLYEE